MVVGGSYSITHHERAVSSFLGSRLPAVKPIILSSQSCFSPSFIPTFSQTFRSSATGKKNSCHVVRPVGHYATHRTGRVELEESAEVIVCCVWCVLPTTWCTTVQLQQEKRCMRGKVCWEFATVGWSQGVTLIMMWESVMKADNVSVCLFGESGPEYHMIFILVVILIGIPPLLASYCQHTHTHTQIYCGPHTAVFTGTHRHM